MDYYREIIEDYSAIPRHLQQQYGVYAGHDRGRIYRLTHRDATSSPLGRNEHFRRAGSFVMKWRTPFCGGGKPRKGS